MPNRPAVIDVNALREMVKRFDDNKEKRNQIKHNGEIKKVIEEAKRLIKTIPDRLSQAAKNGKQSILVLTHYGSEYSYYTVRNIINFCDSQGLGYEYFLGKDEKGNTCHFLYVNFRK